MSKAKKLIEAFSNLPPRQGGPPPGAEPGNSEAGNEGLPPGWGVVKVGDILKLLPRPTRKRVEAILRQPQDVFDASKKLRPLLEPFAAQLEAAGWVASYLSYALPFFVYRAAQQGKTLDDILREQGGNPANN